ncbi:MAG: anaerobic ribonucleoside-triphosphate reductase activating protein [Candidatus Jordarchaeum sp.]|uniref:anaerobic ribonucleoside-triphosphate reductase activating protein n=1 Tax=Candidatus Jordarchaeum sp. TaxID=2823881 RepID=UPI00404A997F
MKVYVYGILDFSTIDYPHKPAMVIFMAGCPFRCPMCHNWKMLEVGPDQEVELSRIFERIEKASSLIEAVKVSGGEPTLYPDVLKEIADFCKKKKLSFGFDTNGFFPESVKELVNQTDLISIDIKGPFNDPKLQGKLCGVNNGEKIIQSLLLTLETVFENNSYADLRTTVIPGLNSEEVCYEHIGNVLRDIGYLPKAEKGKASYTLQQFLPARAYSKELRKIKSSSLELLIRLGKKVNVPRVYLRHRNIGFMVPLEEPHI